MTVDATSRSAIRTRLAIFVAGALLVVIRFTLPANAFWISDAGNKNLVAENFAASGYRHVSIGYPAADIDPNFRWFPAAGGHFRRLGAHYFSIVPWVFPLLAAALGTLWIPFAAGIGILMMMPSLLREAGSDADPAWAVLVTAFATPIAFYSLDFWEHTLATLLATGVVVLLLRRKPLLAGLAAGASIVIRDEGYVLLAAVIIALAVAHELRPRIAPLLAGTAIVIAPYWLAQWMIFGNPFGLHLAVHAVGDSVSFPARIVRNVLYFLFHFHDRPLIAALLALPAAAAIVIGFRRRRPEQGSRAEDIAAVLVGIGAMIGIIVWITDNDPIINTIFTQGLFLFLPFTVLFLTRWRELVTGNNAMAVIARIAAVYVVLMPLVLRANWSGVVWGPRYFLTIVPLLVVLSLRRSKIAVGLIVISFVLEGYGLVLLHRKLDATSQLVTIVRAAPQAVISDVYWLPEELSALYFEKKFMQPPDDRELLAALAALRAGNVREVTVVLSPRYLWYSPNARAYLESMAVRRVLFDPPGVPLLRAEVLVCDLSRSENLPRQ
jgi:hypothetical protein